MRGWSCPKETRQEVWAGRHGKAGGERTAEMTRARRDVRKMSRKEAAGSERVSLPRTQAGEGGEGRSACWLLGTWPAMSGVGRKTPESTSAEERVAAQRLLCSSAPHPLLPLPSQFIYPSSKDSLTVPRGWLKWPRGGL